MSQYLMFKDLGEKSKNKEIDGVKNTGTGVRTTGNRSSGVKPRNTIEKYDETINNNNAEGNVENNTSNKKFTAVVKDLDHKINLINSHKIVVIDVWAQWCQPCIMISDKYEDLAKKYNRRGICLLAKENIDDKIQQPENVVIRGVPSFLFFENGIHVDTVTGADLTEVENKLQEMLK